MAHPPLVELSPILQKRVAHLAVECGWKLVVLFGSTAQQGTGRDWDIAILPQEGVDLLTQGGWQQSLESLTAPKPVDLVLITDALSPLTRFEIFRNGQCLFERDLGLFDRERDRAFFLHADSEWLRRRTWETLRGID
jgi:predicted nucleotidyltransferase